MSDMLWGIIIAAVVGGIIGYVSNVFLDKGRYRREYQKEIIKRKVECYQALSIEIGKLKDAFYYQRVNSQASGYELAGKLDIFFDEKFQENYIFFSKNVVDQMKSFRNELEGFVKKLVNKKISKKDYEKIDNIIDNFVDDMRKEIWDTKTINF